jgi:hypothetical protein
MVSRWRGYALALPRFDIPDVEIYHAEHGKLAPYKLWRLRDLHNYTIDQIRSYGCPNGGETMRINVRSDTVASASEKSRYQFTVSSGRWRSSLRDLESPPPIAQMSSQFRAEMFATVER